MKILQINKYHHLVGGAERYYFGLSKMLKEKGHKVAFFSMSDGKNLKTKWSKYFVSNLTFEHINPSKIGRMIYSMEARAKMAKLLDSFKPDVAHVHNIYYHLSPSILYELKKRNIPVVMTVHDYNLLTPNINFFHDGAICEITKKKKYYKAIIHKCVKNSYLVSFATALTLHIHDLFASYSNNVDFFIAPSLFMKKKLSEYGFMRKKIVHLPNFIDCANYSIGPQKLNSGNKYILYFGRLAPEKGMTFLIDVAKKLPKVNFKIAGVGSQEKLLKNIIKNSQINNVELLGFLEGDVLKRVVSSSYLTITPSLWYENSCMSIFESFALAKPVLASKIGGNSELIVNGKNGLLFKKGDIDDCTKKLQTLWQDERKVRKMGKNAKAEVEEKYNPDGHYVAIMKIYKEAIDKNSSK